MGVSQSPLSSPENLWKAYIDFEIGEGERELARALYERLIGLSGHFKVWISYAEFEAEGMRVRREDRSEEEDDEDEETWAKDEGDLGTARAVWEKGYKDLKAKGLKSEVRIYHSLTDTRSQPLFYFSESPFWKYGRRSSRHTGLRVMSQRCKG